MVHTYMYIQSYNTHLVKTFGFTVVATFFDVVGSVVVDVSLAVSVVGFLQNKK